MIVLLATENMGKTLEMMAFLSPYDHVEVVSLNDWKGSVTLPEETGATMRENARLKAVTCAEKTGLVSLGDDSGIEIDAMGGAPGLYSARWFPGGSEEKCGEVLRLLEGVAPSLRTCRYRCALCLAIPTGGTIDLIEVEAVCEGRIASQMVGANRFAYDPIFQISPETGGNPQDIGLTFGQRPDLKSALSHRARAFNHARIVEFFTRPGEHG